MSDRKECGACYGRGRTSEREYVSCSGCGGIGRVFDFDRARTCSSCWGTSRCIGGTRGRGPMPGQERLNGLFTEADLVQASGSEADMLLHISTHFVLRPGSVAKSWLLLGDGNRLPLERLRQLDLGAPTLVTLSACDTAVVDIAGGSGREVDGLATTLLDRGASQVLASLWRVDDRATARFMQRFYAAYAKVRGQASAALQLAQRQAIEEGAPEREWAAFVLLGTSGLLR